MKDYFEGHKGMHGRMKRRREEFDEVIKRKKMSLDDQITINHYQKAVWDYWSFKYFALKKGDEPKHYQGSILTESRKDYTQEQLEKIYKRNGYKCYTLTLPWFLVWDMYDQLSRKYFKGPAHGEEIEETKEWCDFTDPYKTEEWVSPSKNPLYYWTKAWEYDVSPLEHTDVKEFMRARLKERKKYSQHVVQAKVQQKIEDEATQQRQEEGKKRVEREQNHRNKITKKYIPLETDSSESVCYIIRETERVFTKATNKCNILYIGETSNWISRQKVYANLNNPKNELIIKLHKKFPKLSREQIINRLKDKVVVKRWFLDRGSYEDRLHLEGYLIRRMNPLLNVSKKGFESGGADYKKHKIEGYDIRKGFRVEREERQVALNKRKKRKIWYHSSWSDPAHLRDRLKKGADWVPPSK